MKFLLLPLLISIGICGITGCGSTTKNRNPIGLEFPGVSGENLDGESVVLPGDLGGKPSLLLIGFVQNAQFDIDRWLLGLIQGQVSVPVVEVPTIEGLVPGLIAGTIDEGMRNGIPQEDWASVVTVYSDASDIVAFTGNDKPNNARVVLLDSSGKVAWFHDRGYSARLIDELKEALAGL